MAILSDEIRAAEMSQAPPAVSEWPLARADRNATRGNKKLPHTAEVHSKAQQSNRGSAQQASVHRLHITTAGRRVIFVRRYMHVLPV